MTGELPLNGRNVLQLMKLAPDVSPGGSRCFAQGASRPESTVTFVSASGARSNETAFYLDGGINEDPYTEIANIFPNPDAIQEFSVQTNSYSAKFGGRGGGVVNAATRSGANQFHGSAFEFFRNYDLNARNFFASTTDGLKRNQYGFSLGGPVQKNKTFFFASWQATKVRSVPAQNEAVTPTAAQRGGDFSTISTQLVDPNNNVPFPGNQVPTSRFDPIALKVLGGVPVGAPGTGLAFYPTSTHTDDNQWMGRVDHNFSEKIRVFARYLYDRLEQPSSIINNNILSVSDAAYWQSQNITLGAAYVPNPHLVGDLTLTYNRVAHVALGPKDIPGWVDLGVNVADEAANSGSPVRDSISTLEATSAPTGIRSTGFRAANMTFPTTGPTSKGLTRCSLEGKLSSSRAYWSRCSCHKDRLLFQVRFPATTCLTLCWANQVISNNSALPMRAYIAFSRRCTSMTPGRLREGSHSISESDGSLGECLASKAINTRSLP